jgi:ParB-like chromosome segregation protein Spo0J
MYPIDKIVWIDRAEIQPNDYNPNSQAPPEHRLLILSILEDGWTQPIVVHRETMTIVDGEHRWKASENPAIYARTAGRVPVVFVEGSLEQRKASTIRHNRARGVHGILPMARIVQELHEAGLSRAKIQKILGMEDEEVQRLLSRAGSPERVGTKTNGKFTASWKPDRSS